MQQSNSIIFFIKDVYHSDVVPENASKIIHEILCDLDPMEERVIRLRYGLDDDVQRTVKEIADEFGVTEKRMQQIVEKAIKKLRHPVRRKRIFGEQ